MKNKLFLIALSLTLLTACKNDPKQEDIDLPEMETVETPIQETPAATSPALTYDNLKADYTLFGKWKITNTLIVDEDFPFEIYTNGTEYYAVIPEGAHKIEVLNKKGNDYFIDKNKYGEYYRVDKDMNLTLFDRDGDLTTAGYSAEKVQ
ncbi:hypothetical protein [Bizionia myxarmorum]|uniref:Uncharacterized protein n=1 Tax=Bizionia myxarmorum TaxID=291186 RepID=A0A5D0QXK1_9FLAO|nr:hypothetical protein [Bizionia myxarmorum]TYB73198.1 hypothetical protein ES674_15240 [Bizionia myxarmorum]